MEANQVQIEEINQHISDALEQWARTMIMADLANWSCRLIYSDKDIKNASYIFQHVMLNVAIKSGFIDNTDDAKISGGLFATMMKKAFGIDFLALSERVLNDKSNNVN